MAYSEKVVERFERVMSNNDPNVGSLDKNDPNVGTGVEGAPACGDVLKLQLRFDDDGIITDAKFKTYGCGSAMASSSLIAEWVKGRTAEQALAIKNTQLAQELSLPPVKIHCSVLAEAAVKRAVEDYRRKKSAASGQGEGVRAAQAARSPTGERGGGEVSPPSEKDLQKAV